MCRGLSVGAACPRQHSTPIVAVTPSVTQRGGAASVGRPLMPRRRPDVLLLIIDDMRADLGCYGCSFARTPHIDALSARSTTFLQAHAAVANCAPSRSSLLTGLRPNTHGVLDLQTHVRDKHKTLITLPQRFRSAGYLAVSYGKIFHQFLDDELSWSPQSEFADGHTYRGLRGSAWSRAGGWSKGWSYNQYMTPANRAQQAEVSRRRRRGDYSIGINAALPPFEEGPDSDVHPHDTAAHGAAVSGEAYTDERTANRAIRALARLHAQPRPWLLALGFVRPHLPFNAPARFWARARAANAVGAVGPEALEPAGLSRLTSLHLSGGDGELYDFAGPKKHVTATSERGHTLSVAYAAAVSFVDEQVGRVLGAIRRLAVENDTLTVLLSDHGWKLGHYGGSWGKHTLLAADTHVPLLIAARGFAPKRVHAPVELIDLFPTLCELAELTCRGRAHRPRLAGRSLVPLMRRPSPRHMVARSAALSQWPMRKAAAKCMGYAVRTQGWLLIQWSDVGMPGAHDEGGGQAACASSSDLFRVSERNASRRGVLREELVNEDGARRAVRMRRVLARRLWGEVGTGVVQERAGA